MEFDIFFSISQTPDTTGHTPSESEMFTSFFDQVVLADKLGFGVGWVAQAHLSTEIQKRNSKPVVPHYPGCLLYTSPSPRDKTVSRMPSSA